MKQFLSRALIGALALGTLAACETRTLTEGGVDDANPSINLSTPGQDPDSIDVSAPLPDYFGEWAPFGTLRTENAT